MAEIQHCLNCSQELDGTFCNSCGQKASLARDRRFRTLFGQLMSNLFFVDNRTWLTFRYFLFKPGEMSVE